MLVDVVEMKWTKKGKQFRIITTVTNQMPVDERIDVGGCGGDAVEKEGEAVQDHYHCHKSECLLIRGLMLVDVVAMQWAKKGRQFRIITTITNQNTC